MFRKVKDKIAKTDAGKIWAKNSAEVDAARRENKKAKRGVIAFVRGLQLLAHCFTIYVIVVAATVFIAPTLVSYIGGLAQVTSNTDIFIVLSTWFLPSLFALGLLLAFTLFVIKKMNSFWRKCFDGIVAKIRKSAEKQNSETGETNKENESVKKSKSSKSKK